MLFVVSQQLQLTDVGWSSRMIGKDPARRRFDVVDVPLDRLPNQRAGGHFTEGLKPAEAFHFLSPEDHDPIGEPQGEEGGGPVGRARGQEGKRHAKH